MTALCESLENLLEETPEVINSPGFPSYALINAIDSDSAISDWIFNDISDYAYDINGETAYGWQSRFLEEAYALGILPDEDIVEVDGVKDIEAEDIDAYINDFVDATLNKYYDGNYDYLYNIFENEQEALKLAQDIDSELMSLAIDSIAEAVWSDYGPGHELAVYDGKTIELENEYYAFRQN